VNTGEMGSGGPERYTEAGSGHIDASELKHREIKTSGVNSNEYLLIFETSYVRSSSFESLQKKNTI